MKYLIKVVFEIEIDAESEQEAEDAGYDWFVGHPQTGNHVQAIDNDVIAHY